MTRSRHFAVVMSVLGSAPLVLYGGAQCRADEQLDRLIACRGIAEPTARLACFDREAAPLDVPEPSQHAASARPVPPPNAERQFGLNERAVADQQVAAGTRAPEAPQIDAQLTQLSHAPNGKMVFVLDNGQVWRELISNGELLLKPGDKVAISRASLGSFWLKTPSGRGCRVTRVR